MSTRVNQSMMSLDQGRLSRQGEGEDGVEESLGADLERQIAKFNDMTSAVNEMAPILNNLRSQCRSLKDRQTQLEDGIKNRAKEVEGLNEQIEKLTNDRDSLRIEYSKAQSENTWWNNRSLSASASSTSLVGMNDVDIQGKLNRRIWLLEEQVKSIKKEQQDEKGSYEDQIEIERAISSGLRDRISDLEQKRKMLKDQNSTLERNQKAMRDKLDNAEIEIKELRDSRDRDLDDLNENLRQERKETGRLKGELTKFMNERDDALSELKNMKSDINNVHGPKSPSRVLSPVDINIPLSQPLSSQAMSSQPMTPTKPKSYKPFTPLLTSPSSRMPAPISPTSIAKQHALLQNAHSHLMNTHKYLKDEYDKLRNIHKEDIEHMKKYQASQIERKRKKDERKAKKRQESLLPSQAVTPSLPTSGEAVSSGRTVGHEDLTEKDKEGMVAAILVEESESLPNKRKSKSKKQQNQGMTNDEEEYMAYAQHEPSHERVDEIWDVDVEPRMTSDELVEAINRFPAPMLNHHRLLPEISQDIARQNSYDRSKTSQTVQGARPSTSTTSSNLEKRRSESPIPPPTSQRKRKGSLSTPQNTNTPTRRVVQPTHVTPWLGADHTGPSSSSKDMNRPTGRKRQNKEMNSDDDFASPPDLADSTPTIVRTPLVRDRLGETSIMGGDSLRKMVMRQALPHDNQTQGGFKTPIRGEKNASPGPSKYDTTPSQPNCPNSEIVTPSTAKKRKIADTATEGLTPDEKARKLKKIAKLPVSEKRELYSSYKGKGRYVRPEEVHKTVGEEFEINPSENDGNNFAYHDVRRKKAERKNMHGVGCECCSSYYASIGDLPRYNQPPKWRDEERQVERDEEEGIREHQNMVSRHRETWMRPPTPPGYWKIGFPSTQDVEDQNIQADQMLREKEDRIRREALQKDGKWRKKKVNTSDHNDDDTNM